MNDFHIEGPFEFQPARYAKNSVAVKLNEESGVFSKGRGGRLLRALGVRYSNREHRYIMSKSRAVKLLSLYLGGFDAELGFDQKGRAKFFLVPGKDG